MNVIVCGGRGERLTEERGRALADALWQFNDGRLTLFLGGARGIDTDVERWSIPMGYPSRRFPADWETHGRAAGPIRNAEMAKDADAVIAFPGGHGTADMIRRAERKGIPVVRLG